MARYTRDSIDRLREAVDMADLVGQRTELRRSGANRLEGRCPFHEERTPSFGIDPEAKLYHCFGCGEGGDLFSFVQKTENLDFKGALEFLAGRYGVELTPEEEDPQAAERRQRRERLLELLERAAVFYVRYLWDSTEAQGARDYLASRGLDEAELRAFRVGYAPSSWDTLLSAGRRQGFSNQDLFDAGLAVRAKGEGRIYDRFRRRIMFPLCDLRGNVLGFGARALGADQQPKYLNSSDNDVYHKGEHVFAGDVARAAAAKATEVVVAEGYTDVIALHQAGIRNAVGLMGTAMTSRQIDTLARLAPKVLLALDADSAGQEAMLRAAKLATGKNLDLRVVPLPAGSDPADLVQQQGAQAVTELVAASVPFVRFRVDRELARGDLSSSEGKDAIIDELKPVFATLGPSALREELIKAVAEATELSASLVGSWLPAPGSAPAEERPVVAPAAAARIAQGGGGARDERAFLATCLAYPSAGAEALASVDPDIFGDGTLRRAHDYLRDHLSAPGVGLDEDHELAELIAQLVAGASRMEVSRAAVFGEQWKLELALVNRRLADPHEPDKQSLAMRRIELQAKLDELLGESMEETG